MTISPKSSKRPRESPQPSSTVNPPPSRGPNKRILFSAENYDEYEDVDLDEEDDCDLLGSGMSEEKMDMSLDTTAETIDEMDLSSELTSTDSSSELETISTDDEEALEEYLIYKEAKRMHKRALRRINRMEGRRFDEIDEVNIRFYISETPTDKPFTMTSNAGQAALIDMKYIVLPAREMLRDYFRTTELKRAARPVERVKRNA